MQSVHVTPREGDNDNLCFYWDTYSSALPVKIEHAFSRVILQRRVKTEILYLVLQNLQIAISSTCGTAAVPPRQTCHVLI